MEKQLLLTISDETTCLFGVRFLGSFFQNKSLLNITLFHVAAHSEFPNKRLVSLPPHDVPDTGRNNACAGTAEIEASHRILCNWGFSSERITSKIQAKEAGVVKDIIREAREGLYDSVVLGKKGFSAFENFFSAGVTRRIMEDHIDFPIWISRLPESGRRDVLLCVDGSDASLRMADHVGFMLKEEDHKITILHVDNGHKENTEIILEEAFSNLIDNGISQNRIEMSVIKSHQVVQSILKESERKAYAVLAVGRVGEQKGKMAGWLVGSRSMRLLQNIEKSVLWVSK